jgi:hypothetical protein
MQPRCSPRRFAPIARPASLPDRRRGDGRQHVEHERRSGWTRSRAICEHERVWLHVDAAYAGVAAMVPGCEWILKGADRADSLVVNPHKWLFTPFDLSVLYCRRMDAVRQAFALTPSTTSKTSEGEAGVRNLMDTGIQLGRRFRALKLWMIPAALRRRGIARRARRSTCASHGCSPHGSTRAISSSSPRPCPSASSASV